MRGRAGRGSARRGVAVQGKARCSHSFVNARPGSAGLGMARHGLAGRGTAWQGKVLLLFTYGG